ncbi:MAG: dUTP diphosphatase [Ruthenibacterium sp.]
MQLQDNAQTRVPLKRMRPNAQVPQYATQGSAAADLYAAPDAPITIEPQGRAVIPTGIALALPDAGHVAFVFARSGLAVKHGLALSNGVGVIDSDYRGEISVGLVNLSDTAYTVQIGERIAQMCILPVEQALFVTVDTLDETARGAGGFGSTGRE